MSTKLTLRYIGHSDVEAIYAFDSLYAPPELAQSPHEIVEKFDNCHIGFVAATRKRILGYVILRAEAKRSRPYTLVSCVIHPDYRRKGVATSLFKRARAASADHGLPPPRRVGAVIREDNLGAAYWLRSLGFRAVKVLRDHYPPPVTDAYRFLLEDPK